MKNKILIYLSLIALVIIFYLTLPDNQAKVVVCDVGQGDAIFAIYKNIQMLVDVGPSNKKVLRCLENHLPFWDKTIEVVILTHGDSDHIGGLDDLLRSYKVDKFFSNGYLETQVEQKIYSRKLRQNDVISIGVFEFEVVWPPVESSPILVSEKDSNKNSVVGYLNFFDKKWSMFMSGDMEVETEQRLVWREVLKSNVDVLKVSHHGSGSATSDEILEILNPKVAVISVGKNNKFGHPNDDILKKLEDKNIEIKRTDFNGEILFKL